MNIMKIAPYIICILFLLIGCGGRAGSNNSGKLETAPLISSDEGPALGFGFTRYDFGKLRIKKNPEIRVDFDFANTGSEPLVILKVDVSCSCLSADYPKTPILPGEKGKVTIIVDTKEQKGEFNKAVFVKSNAVNDVELLRIKGTLK